MNRPRRSGQLSEFISVHWCPSVVELLRFFRTLDCAALAQASLLAVALACLGGCASKPDLRRQTDAAFRAGREEAQRQAYESRFPLVTVTGAVRHPKIDWTPDLTLARALVAAEYVGARDPQAFILRRGAEEARITLKELLAGEDWDLQAGDRIEVVP